MNKMNAEELLPVSKLPLISVIIPAYNCGQFIKKSVDSVLEQGLEKLEIIIVDDASTDNTKAILGKEYGNNPRIKIIYNAVNRKQGESRNIGLSVASGKYIFFLDADDWLERGALKHLASIAEIYKSDIVACGAKEVREDGSTQLFHAQAIACKGGEEALYQFSEYRIGSIVWNKLYARELIVKEKIEFITPYVLEDIMFTAKVIYGCRNYISVEDNYYNYLYREKSTMNGTPNELYLQSYVKLYLEMIKFIKEKNIIQDKNLSFRLFSAHCSHNVYPNIVRYIKTHSWDVWEKQCREVCYDDLGLTGYAVADIVIHSMAEREKDIADSKDKLQRKEAELTQVIKEKEQKIENINKSRIWKVRTMLLPIIKIIKRDSTYE
jgi:glycosyltransferase involved in cell wall biosynthesis